MLNAEKYKKEILEFIDKEKTMYFSFKNDNANMLNRCCESNCNYCALYSPNDKCAITRIKWLLSEYKEHIKLTKLEFEIFKWLEKESYKFIVRSQGGDLMTYYSTPKRDDNYWFYDSGYKILSGFNELFKFVQWEDKEPTSIQDILKNCEVMEDDTDKR